MFEYLEKYNFWSGRKPVIGFKRKFYLDKILKSLDLNLVKVLVGQRRSGKSYILRQLISHLMENGISPYNIFYFTKEVFEFNEVTTASELNELFTLYLKKVNPKGKIYIFLDEIQLVEEWEKLVNHWTQSFNYEVFITGSNATLLSTELSSLLSGRYLTFQIFPFSFNEYCNFTNRELTRENFIHYLSETGLPEALKITDNELKISYFSTLFDTIILRDIVQRFKVRDVSLLKELFVYFIKNISKLTAFTNIVKYYKSRGVKTNYETIASYTEYLTNTFSIHQIYRYSLKTKSVLGAQRKVYINDLGFANYLFGFSPDRIADYLENYVYLTLARFGYQVYTAIFNEREIDFIATKYGKKLLLQVSQTIVDPSTYQREIAYFKSSRSEAMKIVVHLDDFNYTEPGIIFVKAWQLENKLSALEKL